MRLIVPAYGDSWIYDPEAGTWSELQATTGLPPGTVYGDLAYDDYHDVYLALVQADADWQLWLYRYAP